MSTGRWVPVAAGVLLVVGVLLVRGGSAAAEQDLLPPAEPTEPSAPPSVPTVDDRLVVEANGVPGARLGSAGAEVERWSVQAADGTLVVPAAEDLPGGCEPAWRYPDSSGGQDISTSVWLVDGLVSSVTVSRWDVPETGATDVATWLGPTLGSPVQAASELPGARTAVERPFGAAGPAVTVVRVPSDGVEVVFSDAVSGMPSSGEGPGRIATVEVRHARARHCSYEALLASGSGAIGVVRGPVLGAGIGRDGLEVAPIGSPAGALAGVRGLTEEGTGTEGCRSWSGATDDGGWLRVVAVDDVVAQVTVNGDVASDLPVAMGDDVEAVRAAYPETTDGEDGHGQDTSNASVEVTDGDRVVTVDLWQDERWVEDVDVAVPGGPAVVRSLGVRDAAVSTARLC